MQVPLLFDNDSAISIVNNPVDHGRSNHVGIRYHFLRYHSQRRDVVIYIM
jgi:hypothetical protein